MTNNPKYVIKRSVNWQYYWVLQAINGEVLIKSEMYNTKEACKGGIASSKICTADSNFQRKISNNGYQYYFNQIANNYQVLGTSEMYNSKQAMENGIAAVKRDAPIAGIEDLS
jgi:uncharacterized protein YegP (UPF0339 family)